jgi:hypothetical protein
MGGSPMFPTQRHGRAARAPDCVILGLAPSPPYSGERAGGEGPLGELRHPQEWPLTLTLSPEYRAEGTERASCGLRLVAFAGFPIDILILIRDRRP